MHLKLILPLPLGKHWAGFERALSWLLRPVLQCTTTMYIHIDLSPIAPEVCFQNVLDMTKIHMYNPNCICYFRIWMQFNIFLFLFFGSVPRKALFRFTCLFLDYYVIDASTPPVSYSNTHTALRHNWNIIIYPIQLCHKFPSGLAHVVRMVKRLFVDYSVICRIASISS